ncbi:hypothetical protein VTJ04DRAFT_3967 [Mycothermus thermophilus]|uniref:uncharacterized protein n=1 Tax=Humicola insolens TaxID=85995 RepID=UPI0037426743
MREDGWVDGAGRAICWVRRSSILEYLFCFYFVFSLPGIYLFSFLRHFGVFGWVWCIWVVIHTRYRSQKIHDMSLHDDNAFVHSRVV